MAHNYTIEKLAVFTDTNSFERLCTSLLLRDYPRIIPLGGSRDKGRDAIEPSPVLGLLQNEDGGTIFQFSLQKTWSSKLQKDLQKVFANGYRPSRFVFVTNRCVTTEARDALRGSARESYKVDLEICDIEWLRARLENPEYVGVRRQYLGLDETTLPAFLTREEYAQRRIDQVLAPDLPLFVGRQDEIERIESFLGSDKRVLIVSGAPGLGKTKLLMEAGKRIEAIGATQVRFLRPEVDSIEAHFSELDPRESYLLIVDDAQDLQEFRQLLVLMGSPEFKDKLQVIGATHPWAKDGLVKEFESRGHACEDLNLGMLSNAEIDQLVQHPAVGITTEQARVAIVKVAEGNPLIAITASIFLKEKGNLAGLTRHQLLSAYFKKVLERAVGESRDKAYLTLAIVAATKGIEYGRSEIHTALADVVGLSTGELDVVIDQFQRVGLVKRTWTKIRVVPDLFAGHLTFDAFFSEDRKYDFEEKVLNPFFIQMGDRIFRSLAEAEAIGAEGATAILDKQLSEARQFARRLDNLQRQLVLHWLKGLAYLRSEDSLLILRSMLEAPVTEPAKLQLPGWGQVEITTGDIQREATQILRETWMHCETCLGETLDLLYLIAQVQDHSRSNQDPEGGSMRVLTEQVIAIEPNKPLRVQDVAVQHVAKWMRAEPDKLQQAILIECLSKLFSTTWHTTRLSHIDRHTVTFTNGLLAPSDNLMKLRAQAIKLLIQLYETADSETRLKIIESAERALGPYRHGEIPKEVTQMLTSDAHELFSKFIELTQPESVAERYQIWKALLKLHEFEHITALPAFHAALYTEGVEAFGHLTGWFLWLYPVHMDWQEAETRHRAYWEAFVKSHNLADPASLLRHVDRLVGQATTIGSIDLSAVSSNIGIVCELIRQHVPEVLRTQVEHIPGEFPHLKMFAGTFLGELYVLDNAQASLICDAWIDATDIALQREAARAMLWVGEQDYGERELQQTRRLVGLANSPIDRWLVRLGCHLTRLQRRFPEDTVALLKEIARRCDDSTLNDVAMLLRDPRDQESDNRSRIVNVTPGDLREIMLQFVRLDSLDYWAEDMLKRLFNVDSDAWLDFWQARIEHEKRLDGKPRYQAVPFSLSLDSNYVATSEQRSKVLERFLEWSAQDEWVYSHNGSQLFELFAKGCPDATQDIVDTWIQSGEISKIRAVARVLKEIGYGEYFLSKARELLNKTDDELVQAYLSGTVGTTGVVSGSLAPVFEARAADFGKWLDDPHASIRAKVFAKQRIQDLRRQTELHSQEDWED